MHASTHPSLHPLRYLIQPSNALHVRSVATPRRLLGGTPAAAQIAVRSISTWGNGRGSWEGQRGGVGSGGSRTGRGWTSECVGEIVGETGGCVGERRRDVGKAGCMFVMRNSVKTDYVPAVGRYSFNCYNNYNYNGYDLGTHRQTLSSSTHKSIGSSSPSVMCSTIFPLRRSMSSIFSYNRSSLNNTSQSNTTQPSSSSSSSSSSPESSSSSASSSSCPSTIQRPLCTAVSSPPNPSSPPSSSPPTPTPCVRDSHFTLPTDSHQPDQLDHNTPLTHHLQPVELPTGNIQIDGPHHFTPLPPILQPSSLHQPSSPSHGGSAASGHELKDVFTSVIKVFTDYTDPNFAQPWQMRRQMKSTGSGFVIDNRRIMTNAHCVAFQNRVLVRKHGSPKKFLARLVAVAHESDLAVLTVDDNEFWEGVHTLEFGDIPNLQDAVVVVGYPTGGDNLSITAGVVSRVDINTYAHSNFRLLCAQIDAAINPGNSGGPAFKDGKVVGVAFQGYDDAQNIGYIVPTPVIEHFLEDLKRHNNSYTGFVTLGITYQPMENCSLRKFLGIDDVDPASLPEGVSATGILVIQSDELRDKQYRDKAKRETGVDISCDEVGVRKNDVILALDGTNVADDGTIFFRNQERVHLAYAISNKYTGDTVKVTVLRNKKVMEVTVPLTPPNFIVPEHQWDKTPRYYIYGGLVFVPMSLDYLKDEFGKKFYERAPSTLLKPLTDIFAKHPGEESIVLSQILASDLTIGYDLRNIRLIGVNGEKVVNLKHLAEILERDIHKTTAEDDNINSSIPTAHNNSTTLVGYQQVPDSSCSVENVINTNNNNINDSVSPPSVSLPSSSSVSLPSSSSSLSKSASESDKKRFVIFEFEHELQLVLDREQATTMKEEIMRHHAIPTYRSLVI
eukprot:GHVQ01013754.1.p1 GENE.GHVQ01013754.1~~GHVQ01013754.1.p1  ORF type:complete len:985 (-),score=224.90 GHVQ01013754.1:166-2859(-)